jgi:transcriptional regulator with XRE-family HTH domain
VKNIRTLREGRGWTQLDLAMRLGVRPETISLWERGKHEPRASQFRELAKLFSVCMEEIALGEGTGGEGNKA